MSKPSARRTLRNAVAVLTVMVMGALLGAGVAGSWSELSGKRDTVAAQRAGVGYLRPLIGLIGALTASQSTAVQGRPIDAGGLRAAVAGVKAADSAHGAELETGTHWSELEQRIGALIDKPVTGASAYQGFGDVVSLAMQLATHVGDTSELVLDAEPSTHYLMDVALLRLSTVMLHAGRAADLSVLPLGGDTAADRAAAIAVARYQVAVAAADITTGLKKIVANTERPTFGADLQDQQSVAGALGVGIQFQSAVDKLAPPMLVGQLTRPVTAAELTDNAARVNASVVALADALWSQLDMRLAERDTDLVEQQRLIIIGASAMLVGAIVLLWLFAPDRRLRAADDDSSMAGTEAEPEAPQISMIDARDLLRAEELVHVGRAVQAGPRERDGAE